MLAIAVLIYCALGFGSGRMGNYHDVLPGLKYRNVKQSAYSAHLCETGFEFDHGAWFKGRLRVTKQRSV